MVQLPPRSTPTDTLLPTTTFFRSRKKAECLHAAQIGAMVEEPSIVMLQSLWGRYLGRPTQGSKRANIQQLSRRTVRARRIVFDCALESHNRSEEHTSEIQSLMRIPYVVLYLKQKN